MTTTLTVSDGLASRLPDVGSMLGGIALPNVGARLSTGDLGPAAAIAAPRGIGHPGGPGQVVVNLTWSPQHSTASPNEARDFAQQLVPELTREFRRQGIL